MKRKKLVSLGLALTLAIGLTSCAPATGGNTDTPSAPPVSATPAADTGTPAVAKEITLWTYPVGDWGKEEVVKSLTDAFTTETGIKVTVEYLAYADGDDKVNTAISAGQAPDLVLEGPERLVANWGVGGHMVNLSDMLTEADHSQIQASVMTACTAPDGAVYEYPLVMTAHCMAINLDAFKEAGADQYIDLTTRTWTTEQFTQAIAALNAKFGDNIGAVYCTGQGGDQGTRALVNNLYGGTFTDAEHTKYTWDDPENIQALEALRDMPGINYDASLAGGDELALFYQEILKVSFCWNIAQQLNPNTAGGDPGKTINGQEIAFMSFPSEDGNSKLQGGIWGFGVFDNGDAGRIEASKLFIDFMANSKHTVDAVKASNFFPVRSATKDGTDLTTMWADNAIMNEYQVLMPQLGDYYQVTKGWTQARTSWWTMLQAVGRGDDAATAVAKFVAEANAAAQ